MAYKTPIDVASVKGVEKLLVILLFDIEKVRNLWTKVEDWVNSFWSSRVNLCKEIVMLGLIDKSEIVLNHILLIVKYYIYCSKFQEKELSLENVINII